MDLYDVIPENLFSPLASKNKSLYVKGLFVLLNAFKQQLKIPRDELISMVGAKLENELLYADFSEEELLENEQTLSGKAHFLVRKLRQTGWILLETGTDFKEYVSVPSYSYQIIQLLNGLTQPAEKENFAFVYSTYSSLKNADETREPFEMVTALYDGADRTEKLVESLKSVYHSITFYNQQLIDTLSVNYVLHSHYDAYHEEIIKRILSPLKIRDSVPKYKIPLSSILKKWLIDEDALESMAAYLQVSESSLPIEHYRQEIQRKIFYILDTYDNLERDYIRVIDAKNVQYTRATTQKIDFLVNSDQTIKGNLIQILKAISDQKTSSMALQYAIDAFELYEMSCLFEESLYERKKAMRRTRGAELAMEDNSAELALKAKAQAMQIMQNKYSKQKVTAFVENLLNGQEEISTKEFRIYDDDTYIMTLLSVVQANDRNSVYQVICHEEYVKSEPYQVPLVVYKRRK
ncbi:MAG: DUF5716 family protein [Alistipes sp.]|nr:DUF5716 family protein [Alistipes sp.]